jgi:hypothetical protein
MGNKFYKDEEYRRRADTHTEVAEAIDAIPSNVRYREGFSTRINHSQCSKGKSDALVITREKDGWVFYCFRCESNGRIPDKGSKRAVAERLKFRDKSTSDAKLPSSGFCLPTDSIDILERCYGVDVSKAKAWLYSGGLDDSDIKKFNIKWSPNWSRVIFPIERNGRLEAWIGRDVNYQKGVSKGSKYTKQQRKGTDRMDFKIDGDNRMVIVEDILSAIKVNKVTGASTWALLTTYFDPNAIASLRNKVVYFWLDSDMKHKIIKMVAKMRSHGVDAHVVLTDRDPKHCSDRLIKNLIR